MTQPGSTPGGRGPFFDRVDEFDQIWRDIDVLQAVPGHFKVYEVVGLGGIGKTRLLEEVHERARSTPAVGRVVWVHLGVEDTGSELGVLRAIRHKVGLTCHLFDTALEVYLDETTGDRPGPRPPTRSAKAIELAQAGSDAATAVLPVGLPLQYAEKVFHRLYGRGVRRKHYQRHEFQEIDQMRLRAATELRQALPRYLGTDIRRMLEARDQRIVVLYDAYERQPVRAVRDRAPWLRVLLQALDVGVHVISTRERLHWDPDDWAGRMSVIPIGGLPPDEARAMIVARLGPVGTEVVDRIVDASDRAPFFLETIMAEYEHLAAAAGGAPVRAEDLPASPEDAVQKLLDHMPELHRHLVAALATLRVFDTRTFDLVATELNLAAVTEMDRVVESYFVTPTSFGHKVHDVLVEHVDRDHDLIPLRRAALGLATRTLALELLGGDIDPIDHVLARYAGLLAGWAALGSVPDEAVGQLLEIGYRFYDAGHWSELRSLHPVPGAGPEHPVTLVVGFLAALAQRRSAGIASALRAMEELEARALASPAVRSAFRIEVAYLVELRGGYDAVRDELRLLAQEAHPFDPTDRSHVRAHLYHADMLTMDGGFREASQVLDDAAQRVERTSLVDWIELVRHRGHVLRFALLMDQAELLYGRALLAASRINAPSLFAKLHTNLAEVRCWTQPGRALDDAALAVELNTRRGNGVEVAKADVARAIAWARRESPDPDEALRVVRRAEEEARGAGYPAAVAFAAQARAVIGAACGDRGACIDAWTTVDGITRDLGTYRHLVVLPALLVGPEAFAASITGFDWIEPDDLRRRARDLLRL